MAQINIARQPDYRDLDLDFQINPVTGDINKKTGEDAIKRSVRNLIFTNFYERPFKSFIGSEIPNLLFDTVDVMTASLIEDALARLINKFEPRVRLQRVSVAADVDNSGFNVTIQYVIINTEAPATFNLFLERIR